MSACELVRHFPKLELPRVKYDSTEQLIGQVIDRYWPGKGHMLLSNHFFLVIEGI